MKDRTEKEVKRQLEMLKEHRDLIIKTGRRYSLFGDDRIQQDDDQIEVLEEYLESGTIPDSVYQDEIDDDGVSEDGEEFSEARNNAIEYLEGCDEIICQDDINGEKSFIK